MEKVFDRSHYGVHMIFTIQINHNKPLPLKGEGLVLENQMFCLVGVELYCLQTRLHTSA